MEIFELGKVEAMWRCSLFWVVVVKGEGNDAKENFCGRIDETIRGTLGIVKI